MARSAQLAHGSWLTDASALRRSTGVTQFYLCRIPNRHQASELAPPCAQRAPRNAPCAPPCAPRATRATRTSPYAPHPPPKAPCVLPCAPRGTSPRAPRVSHKHHRELRVPRRVPRAALRNARPVSPASPAACLPRHAACPARQATCPARHAACPNPRSTPCHATDDRPTLPAHHNRPCYGLSPRPPH